MLLSAVSSHDQGLAWWSLESRWRALCHEALFLRERKSDKLYLLHWKTFPYRMNKATLPLQRKQRLHLLPPVTTFEPSTRAQNSKTTATVSQRASQYLGHARWNWIINKWFLKWCDQVSVNLYKSNLILSACHVTNSYVGAGDLSQWVTVFAIQAWEPEFESIALT